MTLGVTIGKFYPFHLGHDYLIRTAKSRVNHLVVLVCFYPDQAISGKIRADWIRYLHPDVEVLEVLDDLPDAPEPWAKRTLEVLGNRQLDFVFTSEDYGEPWATLMGAKHILVDHQRVNFPISGTKLRADLKTHWQMLTATAKAYFAKRVCLFGVESSGKTTLSQSLAQHYQTVWVPEYGRYYWEGKCYGLKPENWQSYEFVNIAKTQIAWENDLAMVANQVIICDTNALATHIWHRRYLDFYDPVVEEIADSQDYDLYILTEPDFGFVQDGFRDGEFIRLEMHNWFVEILHQKNKPYIRVAGNHDRRLLDAIAAIDSLLVFPPLSLLRDVKSTSS